MGVEKGRGTHIDPGLVAHKGRSKVDIVDVGHWPVDGEHESIDAGDSSAQAVASHDNLQPQYNTSAACIARSTRIH